MSQACLQISQISNVKKHNCCSNFIGKFLSWCHTSQDMNDTIFIQLNICSYNFSFYNPTCCCASWFLRIIQLPTCSCFVYTSANCLACICILNLIGSDILWHNNPCVSHVQSSEFLKTFSVFLYLCKECGKTSWKHFVTLSSQFISPGTISTNASQL